MVVSDGTLFIWRAVLVQLARNTALSFDWSPQCLLVPISPNETAVTNVTFDAAGNIAHGHILVRAIRNESSRITGNRLLFELQAIFGVTSNDHHFLNRGILIHHTFIQNNWHYF